MATYKKSGVDRDLGDLCSEIAYSEAKKTFAARKGMIGAPLTMDGGFTGALDMGSFLIVQNEDGVGSKIDVARQVDDYSTLGYDLVAMVADDAICVGAEVISITNTIDTGAISKKIIGQMMAGLSKACREQKIVVPGGEIAEMRGIVSHYTWNSTAVGIVAKKKFIRGEGIKPGDKVIGIESPNFRSNGFSLVRSILREAYGPNWHKKKFKGRTWGAIALEPSVIYHAGMLSLIGRYGKKSPMTVKGVAHITGGGIPGNAPRMFGKQNLGIAFDNLPKVPSSMLELQRIGSVSDREAYETWNMGLGMVLVAKETEKALSLLKKAGLKASIVGQVTKKTGTSIKTRDSELFFD